MISHEYKCIFVHISRTGGSSIEKAICGREWWKINPATKHLTASQTKEIYKDYWNSYFKFSFVRNPWDRLVSCFSLRAYHAPKKKSDVLTFLKNIKTPDWEPQLFEYVDILDIDLDFVGKYETLGEDFDYIKNKTGVKKDLPLIGQTKRTKYQDYYCEESKKMVEELYKKSIEKYEYKF